MAALKVLVLSDGRPGHYRLSQGIVAAIARKQAVDVITIDIPSPRYLSLRRLSALSNRGLGAWLILSFVYGLRTSTLPRAGLVVSAGGETLAANVAAAKLLNAPNIFYGSRRMFRPDHFSLVMSSYRRHTLHANHLFTPKPSPLAPRGCRTSAQGRPRTAGLLVGGDAGGVQHQAGDWEALFSFLRAQHKAHGTRWIVSNSRRTPECASDCLAQMAAERDGPIETFIDVREAGNDTLDSLFARTEVILCTSDSSSMLSEAIWVRLPVIAVAPERRQLTPDEEEYRAFLEQSGWTRSIPTKDLSPVRFLELLRSITPLESNPLDDLAVGIAKRLPQIFSDSQ